MSIKNILVAVNESTGSADAIRAALLMQQKYEAHLTGFLVHYGDRDRFGDENWVPDNVRRIMGERIHGQERQVEQTFRNTCANIVPPEKLHWTALSGEPDDTLAKYVVMYDVVVMGRNASRANSATDLHPERVALKGGRPVLVVPSPYDPATIDKRAVLAFDGRHAASRLIHDAMTYLETKDMVDVVSFGDKIYRPANSIGAVDLLARHGVMAERVQLPKGRRNIADDLLDYCTKVDAGILFVGVYEHGVFREELFGGATRRILDNATIPVMISH